MIKKVLSIYVIWLILINLFSVYALNRLNLSPDTAYTWINPTDRFQNQDQSLVDLRVHWDGILYLKIASEGYHYKPGEMSNVVFFPLYPILIWLLSSLPIISPILAGWIISTITLGIGLIFLAKLVKQHFSNIDPIEPVILTLIFPTAIFFNAVYTESLFFTLSVLSFYFLLKKNFLWSSLLISLASTCRVNGLFLFLPFLIEYYLAFGWKRFVNPNLLSFLILPLGILVYMSYLYLNFGNPLAFVEAQANFGRNFSVNWEHLSFHSPASYANFASDLSFFIITLVLGVLVSIKIRLSLGVYVLTTILVAVSTGTLMSISRYILILFPIYLYIASIKNQQFQFGWRTVSILLLALYTTFFISDYWAG